MGWNKMALMLVLLGMVGVGRCALECIGVPHALGVGAGCGASLDCGYGLYCARDRTCKRGMKEGDDCSDDEDGCGFGLTCKGSDDFKRCIPSVHPGQDCSSSFSQTLGMCGTGSCVSNTCRGGNLGDACLHNDDCAHNMTCNGVCQGIPIGQICISSDGCVIGAYCDSNLRCVAEKTEGSCSDAVCARGYKCLGVNSTDSNPQCVLDGSRQPGEYCTSDNDCAESFLCLGNTCAANTLKYCGHSGHCAADEVCSCGGLVLEDGYGTCSSFSCHSTNKKYSECFLDHCKGPSYLYFNGSCSERNCGKLYLARDKCGDASFLSFSFFTISFLALFATFFSNL